jgi:outer membrane biosynthesis protein TonB
MDAVTEILIDRSQQADKVTRMVIVSLVAHAALISVIAFMPNPWSSTAPNNAPLRTISLGGAPGPQQGRNPISAKPVQEAVPDTVKPKNDAPPALAKPEMVEPVKTAKPEPKTAAKPEPKKRDLPQLHGSKPTQGAEVKAGAAKVETHGAAIPFGGLATGGGGAGQAYTDYANFCCQEYLSAVTQQIQKNWNSKQGQEGSSVVSFSIRRDGNIVDVKVDQGSNQILNLASQRAILLTQRVPPLPAAFTPEQLTLHLVFQYQR